MEMIGRGDGRDKQYAAGTPPTEIMELRVLKTTKNPNKLYNNN